MKIDANENIERSIIEGLRRRGIEVISVVDLIFPFLPSEHWAYPLHVIPYAGVGHLYFNVFLSFSNPQNTISYRSLLLGQ